jgi:hypothetical protein
MKYPKKLIYLYGKQSQGEDKGDLEGNRDGIQPVGF